jgi:tryptophan synthase alpha chain
VGFGISTADQARAVAEVADGVIVGSRIVRAAGEGGAGAVRSLVAEFAGAVS